MSLEINAANTKSVNWEQILSSIGDVQKTEGVDGKASFTITTKGDDGTRTITVNIPDDLEIPENIDKGTLQDLVDKLANSGISFTDEQIAKMKDTIADYYDKMVNAINNTDSSSGKKKLNNAMFNLYALMALMIDVAQTQRDAQREIRTAQNLSIQKSFQDQADQQRAAANLGMWVGIACGAFSAVGSLAVMAYQGATAKQQANIVKQTGADAAQMQATMLQNTDTKANAQTQLHNTMNKVGDEVATNVSGKFEDAIKNNAAGDLRGNLGEAMQNKATAESKLDAAKTELTAAEENLAAKTATRDQLQARYNELGGDQALNNVRQASINRQNHIVERMNAGQQPDPQTLANYDAQIANGAEIKSVKAQLDAANRDVATATNDVHTKQGNVRIAQEEVKTADTNLNNARADYQKTVSGVAEGYRQEYQTAVDRLANPPEGTTRAELEANVKAARDNMEMAFAVEADMLSSDGVMSPSQRQDLVSAARVNVDATMDRAYRRMDVKALDQRMTKLMTIGNINQSIGGVLQTMASQLSSIKASEATRQQAETTKQEEMLDQTKDLFSKAQNLIDQAIQLYKAVIQAENQSMRDAIQA